MKRVLVLAASVLCVAFATEAYASGNVFWSARIRGVTTTEAGVAAILLDGVPTGPNPSGTTWEDCRHDWVYFHQREDHSEVSRDAIHRMLALSTAAYLAKERIRLNITRDAENKCYTSQIFVIP